MTDEQSTESLSQESANQLPEVSIPPELIQDIPEEKRRELIQYLSSSVHVEQTSGPMPPPSMLAAYSPEVQRIIVEEWGQHGPHRRKLEERVFEASIQQEKTGDVARFYLGTFLDNRRYGSYSVGA